MISCNAKNALSHIKKLTFSCGLNNDGTVLEGHAHLYRQQTETPGTMPWGPSFRPNADRLRGDSLLLPAPAEQAQPDEASGAMGRGVRERTPHGGCCTVRFFTLGCPTSRS